MAGCAQKKGINLPDTDLDIPALTDKDLADLESVVRFGDFIGLSFVRAPEDVFSLQDHLARLGTKHLGVVLKIETRRAFENLPQLLLASLVSPPVGVMVARGDLGVEVGFERLAEVQEEILWLCEAAHVPVIWATQVLEEMAKKGSALARRSLRRRNERARRVRNAEQRPLHRRDRPLPQRHTRTHGCPPVQAAHDDAPALNLGNRLTVSQTS